ncbi:MAG: glycosyltransferase [Cyanobacteria bacterium J06623_7]
MVTISVIIPAYNAEKTIIATVRSVLDQTFTDFEVIIINDGSVDKTLSKLGTITDSRVKVFSYQNSGLSTARNRGIDLARGSYISFLDADDCWTPDKLASQCSALQQAPQAALAYSWVHFQYDTEKKSYSDTSNHLTGNIYPQLLLKNFLHNGSNALIKTAVVREVGYFDPQLKAVEDWDFYLKIAARYQFILVPRVQVIYRQSDTSMTANIQLMEHYLKIVITRAFAAAPKSLQYLKSQSLGWSYKYLAQQCLKQQLIGGQELKLAAWHLGRAVVCYPPNLLEPFTQSLTKRLIKRSLKQALNS